jgi:acyl carrier protein
MLITMKPDVTETVVQFVQEIVDEAGGNGRETVVTSETVLVGEGAVIDSQSLVELMLAIEEFAEDELGVLFEWQSDATLSAARSIFRTPETLASHLKLQLR